MLLGGAITDRISPRLVMLCSDIIRLLLTGLMAGAVFSGAVQIWMLYAFGLGFGLGAGFAIPAGTSIVPMLVETQDLQAGNSIMMGVVQLAGFVGPTLAGILIGSYASSSLGIGLAFAIDAASFAVSAACLWLMRGGKRMAAGSGEAAPGESVWAAILAGIRYLLQKQGTCSVSSGRPELKVILSDVLKSYTTQVAEQRQEVTHGTPREHPGIRTISAPAFTGAPDGD